MLAQRERQTVTRARVVARMSHVKLGAAFDGFVSAVVAAHDRRQVRTWFRG
jgi:hypothetical protein